MISYFGGRGATADDAFDPFSKYRTKDELFNDAAHRRVQAAAAIPSIATRIDVGTVG
jgi:hypothetical protein